MHLLMKEQKQASGVLHIIDVKNGALRVLKMDITELKIRIRDYI